EQMFPESTVVDKLLIFNAILDGSKKVSVVAYDYPGKAVAIASDEELKEKVLDFMSGCDGLAFFYDPKIMSSELESQAHVASFVAMLEKLAPQSQRLPIPVAMVVTKADILPGFSGESQTILISPEDEHLLSEDFEIFLNKILASQKVTTDPAWAGSVRNILVRLSDFLRVIVGRTLNFQIFFISNTGQEPEKVGTDVGRSIYRPPKKIHPAGVKEPIYWLLHAILRNKAISKMKVLTKYVALICLAWAAVYSVPFLVHFKYLMPRAQQVEREILKASGGNVFNTTKDERTKVQTAYGRYENSKWVDWFYRDFRAPSGKVRQFYREFDVSEAVKKLDQVINRFNTVVSDSTLWPTLNPSTDSLQLSPELEALIADLNQYHTGDETSVLFTRSGRVLRYWDLLSAYIIGHSDTAVSRTVTEQVDFDTKTIGNELSDAEKALGATLVEKLKVRTKAIEKKEVAQKAAVELDDLVAEVNGNSDPAYRLDAAVERLRKIRSELTDAQAVAAVDRYLTEARKWAKKQKFTYKIETVPQGSHLHIEVSKRGDDPTWSVQNQIFEGDEYTLEWQLGDDIHIAIDELKHDCNWGNNPSDKKVLKGTYSLFEMEGNVTFDNIGKQISISFKQELSSRLPLLKK
ncbi:MAG: hypothetical protein OEW00_04835, partial [candidate division Zixibacteria bacterium]|nr:hypothetical protein [candidate division Zixibacteria bacterium]